jgi:catechol 2,3-dioxygenase-like lactoylglutathione lyase family enzyme
MKMKKKWLFQIVIFLNLFLLLTGTAFCQVDPNSRISDSPTSIIGFNHIGLSVQNLREMVKFYEEATGFEIVKREKVNRSKNASLLLGIDTLSYETVTFKAPNMLLELTQYSNQQNAQISKMPPQGPGMTHTCYQSPSWESGYDKFKNAGAKVLSRGDTAVDLGGYGVTYAYAHDPEGNMFEMEQLTKARMDAYGVVVPDHPMWMTQVALISPDLKSLADFYRKVLEINPNREVVLSGNARLDDIAGIDGVVLSASWFIMDGPGKMIELMQYENPKTPNTVSKKNPTDLGYSYSFEVEDIQQEYNRMKDLGVDFISAPKVLGEFWMVFANDADGNVFSLRQPTSTGSIYSINNFN